ncbi:hypothetical protein BB559_003442 [Furculomyces boomerangus]|uniref:Aminotransferase class IV n=1 Tax=Furculomyces boomerangus TaxID=61424 RepID=A0A2T9YL80_9FUNG|nr:hypothetical protein BB559_003442 [Furculomyces boomerangus]
METVFCKDCIEWDNEKDLKHPIPPDFSLLETSIIHRREESIFLEEFHLDRILDSAKFFSEYWKDTPEKPFSNIPSRQTILEIIHKSLTAKIGLSNHQEYFRVRILMNVSCEITVQLTPEIQNSVNLNDEVPIVVLDKTSLNTHNPFVKYKTTHRDIYNMSRQRCNVGVNSFDVVLYNKEGFVTESSIANIGIEVPESLLSCSDSMVKIDFGKVEEKSGENGDSKGKKIVLTPSLNCGILGGTMRRSLVESKRAIEGYIRVEDLKAAAKYNMKIFCFNSVRKLYEVRMAA